MILLCLFLLFSENKADKEALHAFIVAIYTAAGLTDKQFKEFFSPLENIYYNKSKLANLRQKLAHDVDKTLGTKLEEKKLEDQKKDEPEINESKKDVEITAGPVPEKPVLEEHTDDKQPAETVEDKDDEPVMPRPIKLQPVQEIDKEKITEKQMAKELIKQGKKLLSNDPSGPINDTAKDSKNVINAVEGASQLLK